MASRWVWRNQVNRMNKSYHKEKHACQNLMNIERPTLNIQQGILPIYRMAERSEVLIRRSMLKDQCSMFKNGEKA
jgi:hypothetical protein